MFFAFSEWLGGVVACGAVACGAGYSRYCLGLMGVSMFQGGGNRSATGMSWVGWGVVEGMGWLDTGVACLVRVGIWEPVWGMGNGSGTVQGKLILLLCQSEGNYR